MADNPARIAPGPQTDPAPTDPANTGRTPKSGDIADVDAATPSFAAYTGANGSDVELVGRNTAPEAQRDQQDTVAALVGATSTTSGDGHGRAGITGSAVSDPPAGGRPVPDHLDDLPIWTFPDGAGADVAPPPAAPLDRSQVELPLIAPVEPAAPTSRRYPLFGPVGRPRPAVLVALLAIATLGVYAIVWHNRVNRELEEFDPKLHARPVRSAIAVAVPWLVGLLVTAAGAALIVAARLSIHIPFDSHVTTTQAYYLLAGLVAVPYLVLLAPFSVVAVVMTLERLRCVEEHLGTTTDRQVRPVGTALLLAIPVVGGLVLLGVEQRRLNAIWGAVAPAGHLSN